MPVDILAWGADSTRRAREQGGDTRGVDGFRQVETGPAIPPGGQGGGEGGATDNDVDDDGSTDNDDNNNGDGATDDDSDGATNEDPDDDDGKGNGATDNDGNNVSGNDDNGNVQRVMTKMTTKTMVMDDGNGDGVMDGG